MLWGSGYDAARAYIEVEHRGKIIQSFWTEAGRTQQVAEAAGHRGDARRLHRPRHPGPREPRLSHQPARRCAVDEQELTVKWERFVSKLEPGQKETYTAVITGPDAKQAVAEMVAAMYDASLDAYLPHNWMERFNVFRQDFTRR